MFSSHYIRIYFQKDTITTQCNRIQQDKAGLHKHITCYGFRFVPLYVKALSIILKKVPF